MLLGMTPFTLLHVVLSLVGIVAGLLVLSGLLNSRPGSSWFTVFLVATAATSLTGFLFPFHGPTPAIVLGILSLIALAAIAVGRYQRHLAGAWRWIFAAGTVAALYFNVFVLIVQAFLKVPSLHALAPGNPPSGPVFGIVQGLALVFFVVMGVLAVRRFRPTAV